MTQQTMSLGIVHHGRGEVALVDNADLARGPLWVGQASVLLASGDLLAALKAFRDCAKSDGSDAEGAIAQCEAAIAKAEGK